MSYFALLCLAVSPYAENSHRVDLSYSSREGIRRLFVVVRPSVEREKRSNFFLLLPSLANSMDRKAEKEAKSGDENPRERMRKREKRKEKAR